MSNARWTTLDLARPMAHLREMRGVSQSEAAALLGLPPTLGAISTVSTGELNGQGVQLRKLLERAEAYGFELEIRVRER